MAAGGLTKREEEESVWDNLVDDSGEGTDYRATPIVGFENGDWDIELPGVETEEETVDTNTGDTETEVAPVVEQQTNVAGALAGQTEEQTEQQVPEEVGQQLVRSNTEEENPVITEEADQTPASLWTQWESLQEAEDEETAQQNTAQAEEEQRLVQSLYSEQDIQNATDYAVRDLGIPADMVTEDYAVQLLNDGVVTPTETETIGDWANNLVSAGVPTASAEAYYNPDTGQVTYDTLGDAILGDLGLMTGGRNKPSYDSFAGMLAGQAFDLQPLGNTQDLPSANQGVVGAATNARPKLPPISSADYNPYATVSSYDVFDSVPHPGLTVQPKVTYPGLNSGEFSGAGNYIPRDQRGGFTPLNNPFAPASGYNPQNLSPEVAAALADYNQYGVTPVDTSDLHPNASVVAKGVQSVVNRWNASEDADRWVAQHMPEGVEWDQIDAVKDDLYEQYYKGLEDGTIEPGYELLGSNEVQEALDKAGQAGIDFINNIGSSLEPSEEAQRQYDEYAEATQAAVDAGFAEGSPEAYRYIEEYEKRRDSAREALQAQYRADLEAQGFSEDQIAELIENPNNYLDAYAELSEQQQRRDSAIEALQSQFQDDLREQGYTDAQIDYFTEDPNRYQNEYKRDQYVYGIPGYTDNGEPDTIRPNDAMEQLLRGGFDMRMLPKKDYESEVPGYNADGTPNDLLQAILDMPSNYGYGNEAPAYNADGTPNDLLQAILDGKFSSSMEEWGMYLQELGVLTPENKSKYQEYLRVSNAEAALAAFDLRDGTGYQGLVVPDEIKPFIASSFGKSLGNEQTMYMTSDGQLQLTEKNENIEKVRATEEQYRAALDALIEANPSMKAMIDAGVVTKDDIMFHFMKGLIVTKPGSGKGSGTGTSRYGGGGGGGYGGGGRGGGSYGSSGGNSAKRQQESRINNIMKNWTF